VNFAGNRCIPAKWRFDRIRPAFPPSREAVTVGVTAATSVVVMNATRITAEGISPTSGTTAAPRR
jgi:gentisate 1,2-dioxygenase